MADIGTSAQQAPAQASPQIDPALARNAQRQLLSLRQAIDAFHKARQTTNEAIAGMRKASYPPQELAQRVASMRSSEMEQRAVEELREVMRWTLQREPNEHEMRAGPAQDGSLGFLPAIPIATAAVVLAGVAGGAWTASSLFGYLTEREERMQAELGIRRNDFGDTIRRVQILAIPVLALSAAGVVGYYYWKSKKGAEAALEQAETTVAQRHVPAQRAYLPPPSQVPTARQLMAEPEDQARTRVDWYPGMVRNEEE